ncbi:MAG: hypothetical protein V1926_03510 [Candidatus Peregrinibacteria bacterium]
MSALLLALAIGLFPSSSGDLSVVQTANQTAAISIAPGAQRVEMFQMTVRASCARDVTIRSIRVTHGGLGASSDIDRVYVMRAGRRVSTVSSIDPHGNTAELRLRSLLLPACSGTSLSVGADFSPDAASAGEHRLEIASSGDIDAGGSSVHLTPLVSLPAFRTVGPETGEISVTYLDLNVTPRYGSDRTVMRFQLHADGQEDQLLSSITLTNDGSASGRDLRNLLLQTGPRTVTDTADALTDDSVRLAFDPPLILKRNETRRFDLKADVRASIRRTIRFIVEEPSDVEAVPVGRFKN